MRPDSAGQAPATVTAIADHIEKTLASAPPLTLEQRERIATLLRPTAGGRDVA